MTAAGLEKARLAQLEGLRDWWNDWGVTLRPRYGPREQLKLGLTAKKRTSNPDDVDGDVEVEDDDTEAPARERATAESLASP